VLSYLLADQAGKALLVARSPEATRSLAAWQDDEGQRGTARFRAGGHLLQRRPAFLARLAGGHADLHRLAFGEQAQAAARSQHRAPVEARGAGHEDMALGVAGGAASGTDGVGRLLHQQGLVAVQQVQRRQATLQLRGKLGQGQVHGGESSARAWEAFRHLLLPNRQNGWQIAPGAAWDLPRTVRTMQLPNHPPPPLP